MNKNWLCNLSSDIETRYGKETCDKLFGNIDSLKNSHELISAWFDNFITGMDEFDDKEFLQQMMADR